MSEVLLDKAAAVLGRMAEQGFFTEEEALEHMYVLEGRDCSPEDVQFHLSTLEV